MDMKGLLGTQPKTTPKTQSRPIPPWPPAKAYKNHSKKTRCLRSHFIKYIYENIYKKTYRQRSLRFIFP
ncbi:hypothetical protein E2C01_010928 [Portunus trituberculatus]|uniref:Uncharacterized protein n=1 Tax=Portunus trituberculatus TaxID=210409 RepID=A0A5B7DA63_PORTR|nr:hypothetical protein [Portunus trituberculatus]